MTRVPFVFGPVIAATLANANLSAVITVEHEAQTKVSQQQSGDKHCGGLVSSPLHGTHIKRFWTAWIGFPAAPSGGFESFLKAILTLKAAL